METIMEEKFKKWLLKQKTQKGNDFPENQINNFCKDLRETIPSWEKAEQSTSLFNILDYKVINKLYSRCREGGDLKKLSWDVGHDRPSNALGRYKEFLKQEIKSDTPPGQFLWVEWFNKLAIAISKENQTGLSEKINKIFEDKGQSIIRFKTYDPFSFLYFLAQKNTKNQKEKFFSNTKDVFNITAPLPDFNNKDYWEFPTPAANINALYYYDEKYEPKLLWDFFQQIISIKNINELELKLQDNQFINNFKSVLDLKGVGIAKLTQTLFLINPNIFFPIDKVLKPIVGKLLESLSINTEKEIKQLEKRIKEKGFSAYFEIIQGINALYLDKKLYEINYELWVQEGDGSMNDELQDKNEVLPVLNQILYGPPGTGKTYSTVGKALEILGATERKDIKSIGQLKEEFGSQVEFVTFHQSFSYEDFVEGLKANSNDGTIAYKVENGVFKQICENAIKKDYKLNNLNVESNASVWKVSLGGSDFNLKKKCFEKGEIRIGWPSIKNLNSNKFDKLGSNNKSTLENFENNIQKGDIVVSLYNASCIDGIAIVKGEFKQDQDEEYPRIRGVEWLWKTSDKSEIISIKELNSNTKLTQKTVYKLRRIKITDIVKLIKSLKPETEINTTFDAMKKPHVLIIDEINRGNISRIFGELITLIEPSKRAGEDEEISVQLPYSKDLFSVPNNLYIIGTMNTADRSLALMDTALRRRFDFTEMMPNSDLVKGEFDNIDVQQILKSINQRIEILYDREHTIGHSFLMKVDNIEDLRKAFKNKILPLLEEYFYDDWEKICLVLNNNDKNDNFYKKEDRLLGDFNKTIYHKVDTVEIEAFKNIYA